MEVRQEACGVLVNAAVNEAVNTGLTTSHHHLVVSHPHSTTTVSDTTPSPAQGHAVNSEGKKGGITPAETPLPQAAVAGDTRVTRGQGTGGQTGGQTEGQQHTSVQDTHAAVAAPPTAPSTASPTASPTALPTAQTMADNDHIESPALSGRRKSAAVACRRYASVLVYQLLHINGASGNVGLRFLQHATMLVEGGDVADHLFVVQVGGGGGGGGRCWCTVCAACSSCTIMYLKYLMHAHHAPHHHPTHPTVFETLDHQPRPIPWSTF